MDDSHVNLSFERYNDWELRLVWPLIERERSDSSRFEDRCYPKRARTRLAIDFLQGESLLRDPMLPEALFELRHICLVQCNKQLVHWEAMGWPCAYQSVLGICNKLLVTCQYPNHERDGFETRSNDRRHTMAMLTQAVDNCVKTESSSRSLRRFNSFLKTFS